MRPLSAFFLFCLALCGCTNAPLQISSTPSTEASRWSDSTVQDKGKKRPSTFVGTWTGRFSNGELAFRREWTVERHSDGTYTISYKRYMEEKLVDSVRENGSWWTEDGLYRETTEGEFEVHSYRFLILSENEILFEKPTSGYTFIDRRRPNKTTTDNLRGVAPTVSEP